MLKSSVWRIGNNQYSSMGRSIPTLFITTKFAPSLKYELRTFSEFEFRNYHHRHLLKKQSNNAVMENNVVEPEPNFIHSSHTLPSTKLLKTKLDENSCWTTLEDYFSSNSTLEDVFVKATFSKPSAETNSNVEKSSKDMIAKVQVRPIQLKDKKNRNDTNMPSSSTLHYQFTLFHNRKATHQNISSPSEAFAKVKDLIISNRYQQVLIQPPSGHNVQMLLKYTCADDNEIDTPLIEGVKMLTFTEQAKSTDSTILTQESTPNIERDHNRKKHYILEEGKRIPFLVDLGIMHPESGKVLAPKYNKFRQMNHFLEIFKDTISESVIEQKDTLRIIDFGCGKSYLTFALHYYLKDILKIENFQIIGLDLKADVIEKCNTLAIKYGMQHELKFVVGDIHSFELSPHFLDPRQDLSSEVDIVVSLHACNTATDKALAQSVKWSAKCIISVPCCHHEVYQQLKHAKTLPEDHLLYPLLKHGSLSEKFCSLYTDSLRCQLLEIAGYKTSIVEFIETEHTPKNLMIRAIKPGRTPTTSTTDTNKIQRDLLIQRYVKQKQSLPVKISLEDFMQSFFENN
ncbi:hypothetical protein C9374_008250 [Naegleria lovaniensis]|uniref:Methyltransferase domain-containing protein n=1 Tax=Naegleria lovaniensis TaxID=51637 RepID=A0AA88KHW2_NAELO|nr:uncharacterized protein C9374_008250 [Naegleria lovaniensis]KAG2378611.1 hypothetical protein C9374_008250 [Naegleria lovaniensis]